ncbi:formate dehydrogenase accessory protein FdhE [Pelotomaculum propionicicum]|uniref:formate dehydrogenase accessory protein FdhE n=1 Tax=Pelotomaculum propionicicum TaxID=258475 RepID=UPI003B81DBF6
MQNPSLQEMLVSFHQEFLQISVREDAVTFETPGETILKQGREKSIPLVSICPPRVKAEDFFATMKQVAGVIKNFMPDLAADTEQIESALPVEPAGQEEFAARAFTPGVNLLTYLKSDVPPETFGFLLNHTVKPFMRQYAVNASKYFDPETWLEGNCPVCGGKPTLALLEKEKGGRYLYCGLCEVKWRFHRLGCPYCASPESHFFTVEGMEKYRVYYCDKCHGYIKTIDGARAGDSKLNLFWEDINTVQLDILAMREGYFNQQVDPQEPEK